MAQKHIADNLSTSHFPLAIRKDSGYDDAALRGNTTVGQSPAVYHHQRPVRGHPYTPVNGSPVLTRFSPLLPNRQSKTAGSDRTLRFFYALRHV
jgi:hypothetical protein